MNGRETTVSLWGGIWLVTVVIALAVRPLMPVDETRYLAVAWEMWRDGNFLVPHLNGETYSHKPPLLFWSMHLGWALFGVNDWWPRLVAPLFALASLGLTAVLARRLWPLTEDKYGDNAMARWAPVVLAGFLYWTFFTTITFFDMLLTFAALVGLLGVVNAWRAAGWADTWRPAAPGFVLMGLGIGIGVLAKGPAILLHILPIAFLVPLWGPSLTGGRPKLGWRGWYAGCFAAIGLGVAIALAWAIPAGITGGEEYRNAIFWGQSAGRMVESFAHARPVWWFAAVLPVLLLPWTLWPGLWQSLFKERQTLITNGGTRFCLIWLGVAFIAFSMISGKQPHYLLPEFPAIALLIVFALKETTTSPSKWGFLPVAIITIVIGVALLAAPALPLRGQASAIVAELNTLWGLLPLALGIALLLRGPTALPVRITLLSLISAVLVVTVHGTAAPYMQKNHNITPVARYLAQLERDGYSLVYFLNYHGQFNFPGRLSRPVTEVARETGDIDDFLATNPKAKVIRYFRDPAYAKSAEKVFPYRAGVISIWPRSALLHDATILRD